MKLWSVIEAAGVVVAALVGGCDRGLVIGALEDVNYESSRRTTDWLGSDFDQDRRVSVAGVLPVTHAGELSYFRPGQRPSMSVSISAAPGRSYRVVTTYAPPADGMAALHAARASVMEMHSAGQRLIDAVMERGKERVGYPKPESGGQRPDEIVAARREEFAAAQRAAVESLRQNNLVLYRWTRRRETDWLVVLGDFFTGRSAGSSGQEGYALVGGLRVESLVVGSDIGQAYGYLARGETDRRKEKSLATQVWQARHILSFSETASVSELRGRIAGSYSEFANLGKTLSELDRIELEAVVTAMTELSNTASLTEPTREVFPIRWTAGGEAFTSRLRASEGWSTFYVVGTNLKDLIKMVGKK